jgi:hypothetical protein
MERRGQAAMEFMMTYGWAILAAIVVIGVLAIYFRPSSLASQSAIPVINSPFYGVASLVNQTAVKLELRNNGGEDINLTGLTLSKMPSNSACLAQTGLGSLAAGNSTVIALNCSPSMTATSSISADILVTYIRPGSSLSQSATGTLGGKVGSAAI